MCFEPLAGAFAELAAIATPHHIEVHNVALAAQAGNEFLHVSKRDDSSSLLAIGARQAHEYPGTEENAVEHVEVTTLANFLQDAERPTLLKIDVQGGELEVLKGAGSHLDGIDSVFVEASFVELYEGQPLADEIVAFMLSRGFRLVGVYEVSHGDGGAAIQADLLFSAASHSART